MDLGHDAVARRGERVSIFMLSITSNASLSPPSGRLGMDDDEASRIGARRLSPLAMGLVARRSSGCSYVS